MTYSNSCFHITQHSAVLWSAFGLNIHRKIKLQLKKVTSALTVWQVLACEEPSVDHCLHRHHIELGMACRWDRLGHTRGHSAPRCGVPSLVLFSIMNADHCWGMGAPAPSVHN